MLHSAKWLISSPRKSQVLKNRGAAADKTWQSTVGAWNRTGALWWRNGGTLNSLSLSWNSVVPMYSLVLILVTLVLQHWGSWVKCAQGHPGLFSQLLCKPKIISNCIFLSCVFFLFIECIGVILTNKVIQVSGTQLHNTSVHCVECSPLLVKSPSIVNPPMPSSTASAPSPEQSPHCCPCAYVFFKQWTWRLTPWNEDNVHSWTNTLSGEV